MKIICVQSTFSIMMIQNFRNVCCVLWEYGVIVSSNFSKLPKFVILRQSCQKKVHGFFKKIPYTPFKILIIMINNSS